MIECRRIKSLYEREIEKYFSNDSSVTFTYRLAFFFAAVMKSRRCSVELLLRIYGGEKKKHLIKP